MSRVAEALQKAGRFARLLEDVGLAESFDSTEPPAAVASPRKQAPEPTQPRSAPETSRFTFQDTPVDASVLRSAADNERLVVSPKMDRLAAQQYRKLASVLHQLQTDRNLRTVLVSSAVPDEGKSITAANLALTLSASFRRRVLLIDADLRRPTLDQLFATNTARGLLSAVGGDENLVAPLKVSDRLSLLVGDRHIHDPITVLSSDRLRILLEDAATSYDWVIIDSPPVNLFSDASLLSMVVDGVVLVVRASNSAAAHVQQAIATLTPERIIGVVLNGTDEVVKAEYRYYGNDDDGRYE